MICCCILQPAIMDGLLEDIEFKVEKHGYFVDFKLYGFFFDFSFY
jgi:hypothetical protein